MSEADDSSFPLRGDLLMVLLVTGMIIVYCISMLRNVEDVHAATVSPATAAPAPSTTEPHEWVKNGEAVPSEALYNEITPAPQIEAKAQSWHNKILFPSVVCPYCGRRVPTKQGTYFWLLLGFIGQLGFTSRFFVQWLASERARASVIPTSFWYLSIFGSVLLLTYAISIRAWPIILGQTPNIFIYTRNLYFIRKTKEQAAANAAGQDADGETKPK